MRHQAYRDFFDDLSSMLRAGIPVVEALGNLSSLPRSTRGRFVTDLLERMGEGATLAEAMTASPQPVSAVDVALVQAGEQGGKLVEILDSIVRRLDARKALREDLIKRSLYGLSTLVLACLLLPLYLLVTGDAGTYFLIQACIFIPVFLVAWVASRGPDLFPASSAARDTYEKLLLRLPILGGVQARRALARAFDVLGILLQAGLSYREAIPLAAEAAGWGQLRRTLLRVAEQLESGKTVAEALRSIDEYVGTSDWRERVVAGEAAGSADRAFREIATSWDERFQKSAQALLRILPIGLILLVGLIVLLRLLDVMGSMYGPL